MTVTGEFTVRELQARDLPVLKTLLPSWTPARWNASGSDDASAHRFRVLVRHAHGSEELAGIAELQQIVDEGHLHMIAIVPALQGRGLGRRLLDAACAELRSAGCRRCLLEVRRSNATAQALYQRAGFALDGVRKDYYPGAGSGQREDALLYSLVL